MKKQNRRILKIIAINHYREEYYEYQNGAAVKVRELDYAKVTEKLKENLYPLR
jgi:hypothetical protein